MFFEFVRKRSRGRVSNFWRNRVSNLDTLILWVSLQFVGTVTWNVYSRRSIWVMEDLVCFWDTLMALTKMSKMSDNIFGGRLGR